AWPVDFNMELVSFEPNIRGVRNIINFSRGSPFCEPPVLLYTSSIGIFQCKRNVSAIPFDIDPNRRGYRCRTGYTESKWVAEEIIARSAKCTAAKGFVVRVGQLCGEINGAWNVNEWVLALIQSVSVVGCILDDVKWLPVDVATAAILDYLSSISVSPIVHLVYPQPVSWSALGHILATELSTTLVPYAQWLPCIEEKQAANSSEGNNGVHNTCSMLGYFPKPAFLSGTMPCNTYTYLPHSGLVACCLPVPEQRCPKLDLKYSLEMSMSLRSLSGGLGEEEVKIWIKHWQGVGLLYNSVFPDLKYKRNLNYQTQHMIWTKINEPWSRVNVQKFQKRNRTSTNKV
ncbi:hypothetical protein C8J57DRAFT_1093799, partial [Mycena rebaudengoi]